MMENTGLTGIIPFMYPYMVQKPVGSTDLRAEPIVKYNADFEKWIHGKKYDNLIFQQTYWKEMAMLFQGPKIIDVCDPDWLKYSVDFIELCRYMHAVTCSSESLTDLVKCYFPDKIVEHVPDRFDFSLFPEPHGVHRGKAKKAVWFGYTHNAHETLPQLVSGIKEADLELLIIANEPYSKEDEISALNPGFVKYGHYSARRYIAQSDILLNPRSERAYFRYKSNNKSVVAWKLGIPVAATNDGIIRFLDPDERNRDVENHRFVEHEYNIEKSAQQYRDIICKIKESYSI